MQIEFSEKELFTFKKVAKAADKLQLPCYLIGGFVRDKILNRPNKDADIMCVGDAIELAHEVAELFNPKPPVAYFKNFGTAQIKLPDIEIEFVGARKESYDENSRNPSVESGTLEEDQKRRDFTINALAISLDKNNFGEVVDPFNGIGDLKNRILKTPLGPLQPIRTIR
jgi:tRNA nucleotidyltransferase/poly(A) polymerase